MYCMYCMQPVIDPEWHISQAMKCMDEMEVCASGWGLRKCFWSKLRTGSGDDDWGRPYGGLELPQGGDRRPLRSAPYIEA